VYFTKILSPFKCPNGAVDFAGLSQLDYHSEKIDLSDSRVYRDLSKPIGRQCKDFAQTVVAHAVTDS
jgi:hypothetical protein